MAKIPVWEGVFSTPLWPCGWTLPLLSKAYESSCCAYNLVVCRRCIFYSAVENHCQAAESEPGVAVFIARKPPC